jgi:hypothetical protein
VPSNKAPFIDKPEAVCKQREADFARRQTFLQGINYL